MKELQSLTTHLKTPFNHLWSSTKYLSHCSSSEDKTLTDSSFFPKLPTPNVGDGLPAMIHSPILWTQLDVLEFNSDTIYLELLQTPQAKGSVPPGCSHFRHQSPSSGSKVTSTSVQLGYKLGVPITLSSCLVLCYASLGCRAALAYVCWFVTKEMIRDTENSQNRA